MPFSSLTDARKRVPAIRSLNTKQGKTFVSVFNSLESQGVEESSAIAQAISTAKRIEKDGMQKIIKAVNEEERVSVEVIYEPYVVDAHGEYMSAETIRDACDNFNSNLEKGHIIANKYHSKDSDGSYMPTEDFTIIKSYVMPVDCVVGETPISAGTWLAELQWNNDSSWNARKSGVYSSTSIGAKGTIHEAED